MCKYNFIITETTYNIINNKIETIQDKYEKERLKEIFSNKCKKKGNEYYLTADYNEILLNIGMRFNLKI